MGQIGFIIVVIVATAAATVWVRDNAVGHCVDVAARATVQELQRADIKRTTELIEAVQGLREDLRDALDDEALVCGGDDAAVHGAR